MATTNNDRTLTTASVSKATEAHSLERLKDALITVPIFLMLFIQSLLFELLDFFFEMKFESFPTIVLVAEPGSGKTPTVKAIYRPDETVQMFLTPRRFEKFILKCSGRILFDDFLDANSQAECQRLKLNYDMGVRYSFNGIPATPATATTQPASLPCSSSLKKFSIYKTMLCIVSTCRSSGNALKTVPVLHGHLEKLFLR